MKASVEGTFHLNKMVLRSKNGVVDLAALTSIAVMIIIAIVAVVVGAQIQASSGETSRTNTNTTVTNESFVSSTNTYVKLANQFVTSVEFVANATGGKIAASTYNLDVDAGRINVTNADLNSLNLNITYAYNAKAESGLFNVTRGGAKGLKTFGDYWVIIVISVMAAMLIGGVAAMGRAFFSR